MSTQATGTDPGSKSATEIERDVQQSRAEIEHTLDAIQERLSPGQLVDQAVNYFRGGRGVDFARNLGDSIAANPIPVTLMGVGLAWMMISGQRTARNGDQGDPAYWDRDLDPIEEPYAGYAEADGDLAYLGPEADAGGGFGEGLQEAGSSAMDRMGEAGDRARDAAAQARDRARDAGAQVRDRARDVGAQVRDRFGRTRAGVAGRAHDAGARARYAGRRAKQGLLRSLDEQPLVLGAIGLAIGAALGAALPPTETEDELMGETRDKALRRATEVGREQAEKVRDAAGAVASAAREEAGKQASTAKSSGEPGPGETRQAGSVSAPPFAADPKSSLDRT